MSRLADSTVSRFASRGSRGSQRDDNYSLSNAAGCQLGSGGRQMGGSGRKCYPEDRYGNDEDSDFEGVNVSKINNTPGSARRSSRYNDRDDRRVGERTSSKRGNYEFDEEDYHRSIPRRRLDDDDEYRYSVSSRYDDGARRSTRMTTMRVDPADLLEQARRRDAKNNRNRLDNFNADRSYRREGGDRQRERNIDRLSEIQRVKEESLRQMGAVRRSSKRNSRHSDRY